MKRRARQEQQPMTGDVAALVQAAQEDFGAALRYEVRFQEHYAEVICRSYNLGFIQRDMCLYEARERFSFTSGVTCERAAYLAGLTCYRGTEKKYEQAQKLNQRE